MKSKVVFLLSIGLILLSLPALADPPADAGVNRIQIEGFDDWAWPDYPLSPGTITCPGGVLMLDEFGMPYCGESSTGRLHFRDAVLWSCISAFVEPVDEPIPEPRISGVGLITINGNFDADSTGPVWGKWKIYPTVACEKSGPYPADEVQAATMYWSGTWQGKRLFYVDMGVPTWVGDLDLVGKGNGGYIDGLHFKGIEIIKTYTPFPIPNEALGISGLDEVPEGFVKGTITE